ncbi:MAG: peptide MFS transporter [Planctomycetota bacterium]
MSDAEQTPADSPAQRSFTPAGVAHYFSQHPTGFWFIFWGELAERASYYGMRAILALYLVDQLDFKPGSASQVIALFGAAVYLLPLAGGYLADHYFGKYRTIVAFSLPYILGHVVLGIESRPFLYTALALLAMGSGVIKPNISPLMAMTYDQRRPGQTELRSDAFAMFYFAINVGAAASQFMMPLLRKWYDYQIAFLFPAGLMVVAFAAFAAGKPYYAVETIAPPDRSPEHRRQQWDVLARLAAMFLVVSFFWMVFEQSPSTWTFFARDYMDLSIGPWTLQPDQLQAFNPVLILILLPWITVFWRVLGQMGLRLRATDKMMVGFVLTALSMAVMSGAGFLASESEKVSILWEFGAYLLITTAEICISVVGLELAYTVAPPSLKSFVTGCWLATVFIGNMVNSVVTPLYDAQFAPGPYFGLMTVIMVFVALAFAVIARRFNQQDIPPATPENEG